VRIFSIKLYRIYILVYIYIYIYMLRDYQVIYSVRYYPRFHVTAVGLGTYYLWVRGHYSIYLFKKKRLSTPGPRGF
jgi:hypothetical protein